MSEWKLEERMEERSGVMVLSQGTARCKRGYRLPANNKGSIEESSDDQRGKSRRRERRQGEKRGVSSENVKRWR
tara:strand:+ start:1031 stop:1252 length:222 start_codon:yes stop_codon:yes gene_type:complete